MRCSSNVWEADARYTSALLLVALQRLAAEVNKAQTRLAGVMQNVLAPFQADDNDQVSLEIKK